ncbi:hypothetical protein UlMin_026540 [Ulmus minor]
MYTSNHLSGLVFSIVYFEDDRDAEDVIRGLDNRPFGYDRCKLSVEWAWFVTLKGTLNLMGRFSMFKFEGTLHLCAQFETLEDATKALECTHMSPRRGGYGRRGDSPYGRSPSPMYRRRPSPNYGCPCSLAYDRYNGLAYDKRMSPDHGQNIGIHSPICRS